MAQRPWTAQEIRKLRRCWKKGESLRQISRRLHRSRNSVASQTWRQQLMGTQREAPSLQGRTSSGMRARRHGEIPCLVCGRLFRPQPAEYICDRCKSTRVWDEGRDFEMFQ